MVAFRLDITTYSNFKLISQDFSTKENVHILSTRFHYQKPIQSIRPKIVQMIGQDQMLLLKTISKMFQHFSKY
jgi:hypothetical protein